MNWHDKFVGRSGAKWWITYRLYLASPDWKRRRDRCLKRDKGCRVCNAQHRLEAHHRTYANIGNEQPEDLTVLCYECHKTVTAMMRRRRKKANRTMFDNVISAPTLELA